MDMTTKERVHRLGIALEGDMRPIEVLSLGDLLHRDMETGAGPRRSIVDLAGIGLGVGDELWE